MSRKLAIVLALLVSAAAICAVSARAAAPFVYSDPTGDSATAPDVQQVQLTDNGDGTVAGEIDLAATIPADDDSYVCLEVDADRDRGTGDELGAEYFLYFDAGGFGFGKWSGSKFELAPHHSLQARLDGGRITFTLTLADVGVSTFDFIVMTGHGDDYDAAPARGAFAYPQAQAPTSSATVQAAPAAPTITMVVISATALFPKAGGTMTVPAPMLRLGNDAVVAAASFTCKLTYKGGAVKPLRKCAWKLPKAYKGKRLSLTVTASYKGQSSTVTLPVKPG